MKRKLRTGASQRVAFICTAAIIAALYVALTCVAMVLGLDKNTIQIRFSEALVILAFITPAAIPGVTVGCLLANLMTGCALLDIILGPVATLIGALGAYLIGRISNRRAARWLCTLPNIIANTVIVTFICYVCYTVPSEQSIAMVPFYASTIFLGEVISSGILGTVLLLASEVQLRKMLK